MIFGVNAAGFSLVAPGYWFITYVPTGAGRARVDYRSVSRGQYTAGKGE